MAREDEKSLYISLIINYETVSTNRNQDEKNFAIDITGNEDFVNTTFTLPANTVDDSVARSTKILEDIESFFYAFYPYGDTTEVIAKFTKMDNTTFSIRLNNALMISESFKKVEIKNKSTEFSAAIKTIYS